MTGGNQPKLSYHDIIRSHIGLQKSDMEGDSVLDVDLARKTGYLITKNRNLEKDYLEAQDKLHEYSMIVVDLEEQMLVCKDQNEKFKKGLECGICLQIFSVPITLPCSHTYCYECILQCFAPPTGKGSDKTFFQVEKCPICRASIRLEMTPSIVMRDLSFIALKDDPSRIQKMDKDLAKLKRHLGCIRLGAHCSGKMCLRPRVAPKQKASVDKTVSPSPFPTSAPQPEAVNPLPRVPVIESLQPVVTPADSPASGSESEPC